MKRLFHRVKATKNQQNNILKVKKKIKKEQKEKRNKTFFDCEESNKIAFLSSITVFELIIYYLPVLRR